MERRWDIKVMELYACGIADIICVCSAYDDFANCLSHVHVCCYGVRNPISLVYNYSNGIRGYLWVEG
jgi:hypothetical protein